MEENKQINYKQIVSAYADNEKISQRYFHVCRNELKVFGITITKKRQGYRYFSCLDSNWYSEKEILNKGYLVRDKKVYIKPKVVVSLADGSDIIIVKDTFEECDLLLVDIMARFKMVAGYYLRPIESSKIEKNELD